MFEDDVYVDPSGALDGRPNDECLKHSCHTRVCITVLASFYI